MEAIAFATTTWHPAGNRKFDLGLLAMTPTIQGDVENGLDIKMLIGLHAYCVWGELSDSDKKQNDEAVENGGRILSRYLTPFGEIWIITEADRSVTTVLHHYEYC